jgi:hypothetical protein
MSTEFCENCERNGNNDIPKFLWYLVGPITDGKADVKQGYFCSKGHFWKNEDDNEKKTISSDETEKREEDQPNEPRIGTSRQVEIKTSVTAEIAEGEWPRIGTSRVKES